MSDYTIKNYRFVWHVAEAGKVKLKIQKDPTGLNVVFSSPGGKLARLALTPAQAKGIGKVLLKTNNYFNKHQNFFSQQKNKKSFLYDDEHSDKVPVGNYQVVFHSSPKGKKFEVKVSESKMFSAAVLLTKGEAQKIAKYLVDAEKMAAIVNKRIKP